MQRLRTTNLRKWRANSQRGAPIYADSLLPALWEKGRSMSAPDLLPCPFCGAQPVKIPCAMAYPDWWQCVIVHDGNDGHYARAIGNGDTEQEAIEAAVAAWNRRAERTCRRMRHEIANGWIMHCSECGNTLPLADNYCSNCGAKVVRDE